MHRWSLKAKHYLVGGLTAVTLGMSGTAVADGWRGYGHHRHHYQGHYCPDYPQVVEEYHYYYPPQERVAYVAPTVVYQQPVYQQPVYQPPVYQQPAYYAPAYTPSYGYARSYGGGDRLLTNAVFGAAGGYLGSRIGNGSGRAAATAAGALGGWLLGNHVNW